jgi:parvulin-like peptidyl-prolyl cis-trans isomerase-like protein
MLGSTVQLPDLPILEESFMRKSWLLCVFLGALAWGQAPTGTPPAQAPGAAKAPAPAAEVAESAIVLTIKGVCPATPKTVAASKTGASKATTSATKKPAGCKTEITRAQFEKLTSALQPGANPLTPQQRRQLAGQLPQLMALSEAAKAKGLDKTTQFTETMKFVKMRVLTSELQRTVQEEADKVPPEKITEYYKTNPEAYEQFSLDRLFIPRFKQPEVETKEDKQEKKEPEKLTEEQQKAKDAADQAKREEGEQEMNKLADSLRAEAAAGEDFAKLQKEAFEAAGTKVANPTVNLPKVRRTGLPPAHASAFDLKVGEVSAVISDNGGHYIYKVVSKEILPLDPQIENEIHNRLKAERLKEMMDKYTNSFQAVQNEAYFGPPGPEVPMGGHPPGLQPRVPRPQMTPPPTQPQGTPPAANPPAQPPPGTPPASKPD